MLFLTDTRYIIKHTVKRQGTYTSDRDVSWFDISIFRQDESWTGGERQEPIHALVTEAWERFILPPEKEDDPKFMWADNPNTLTPWLYRNGSESKLVHGFEGVLNAGKPEGMGRVHGACSGMESGEDPRYRRK